VPDGDSADWVTDRSGYRYDRNADPVSGVPRPISRLRKKELGARGRP
jgi:hypothetical protein